MHEEKKEFDEAIQNYEKVMEIDKRDHKTLVNLAILKDKVGRREEALVNLERAIAIKGTDRKIHTNLAIIKRKEGKIEESQHYI